MATKPRKWVYTMLLNFRIKNFNFFKEKTIFSQILNEFISHIALSNNIEYNIIV